MARQNTRRKNRRVNRKTTSARKKQEGAILPFITGICVGLFVAFVVYLKVLEKPAKQKQPEPSISFQKDQDEAIEAASDKPEFDFYTILPEREVKVPEWEPPPAVDPAAVDEKTAEKMKKSGPGTYVFQVGSFQNMKDADSVKARLIMLGFPVEIQRVVINGQKVWFRVRVGPYSDASQLNKVRQRLAQNNMDYILLRIKDDG